MTWTCRFNFGGVDDLGEALPPPATHTYATYEAGSNRDIIPLMDRTYRQHGGEGDGGGWQQR